MLADQKATSAGAAISGPSRVPDAELEKIKSLIPSQPLMPKPLAKSTVCGSTHAQTRSMHE